MRKVAIKDVFTDSEKFSIQELTPDFLNKTLASTIDKGQLLPACFLLYCGAIYPALENTLPDYIDTFLEKIKQQMAKEYLYDIFLILAVQRNQIKIFDLLTKSNRWNRKFIESNKFNLKLIELLSIANKLKFSQFSDNIYQLQKKLRECKIETKSSLINSECELDIKDGYIPLENNEDHILDIKSSKHRELTDHCFELATRGLDKLISQEIAEQPNQTQYEVLAEILNRGLRNNQLFATHSILETLPDVSRLAYYLAGIRQVSLVQTLAVIAPTAVLETTSQRCITHNQRETFNFLIESSSSPSAFLYSALVDLYKETITQTDFYKKFQNLVHEIGKDQTTYLANKQVLVYICSHLGININMLINEIIRTENQPKPIDKLAGWLDLSPEAQDLIKYHARYAGLSSNRIDFGMPSAVWNIIKDYIHCIPVDSKDLLPTDIAENKAHLQRVFVSDYGNFSMYSGQFSQSLWMIEEARRLIDKSQRNYAIPISSDQKKGALVYIIILALFLYLLTTLSRREHLFDGPMTDDKANAGLTFFIMSSGIFLLGTYLVARYDGVSDPTPRSELFFNERMRRLFCRRQVNVGRFSSRFFPTEFKAELDSFCDNANHARFNAQDSIDDVRSELKEMKSTFEASVGSAIDRVANKERTPETSEYESSTSSSSSRSPSSTAGASLTTPLLR